MLDTRLGAGATLHFGEEWSVETYSVYYWENDWSDRTNLNSVALKYQEGGFRLDLGKIATATTLLHRPHPVSSGGQFETEPMGWMLGGGYGFRIQYGSFLASLTDDGEGGAEVSLGFTKEGIKASLWYGDVTQGIAVTTNAGRLRTTNVWSQNILANTLMIDTIAGVTAFSDVGYNTKNKRWTKSEFGVFRDWKLRAGIFTGAISCRPNKKELRAYLWLHF